MSKVRKARYQFYLDSGVAKGISQMGKELGLTRSQLVRDAMQSLVELYSVKTVKSEPDYQKLWEFSGIIKIPARNLSARVDDIYLIDQLREQHGFS